MYILVNTDIEISKGKLAGQVGHASITYLYNKLTNSGMSEEQLTDFKSKMKDYMLAQKKIILKAKESQLLQLEKENEEHNLGYAVIRDAGATELEPNTITCICVGISGIDDIPKKTNRMRLYTN